jgi:hypothetical protein
MEVLDQLGSLPLLKDRVHDSWLPDPCLPQHESVSLAVPGQSV